MIGSISVKLLHDHSNQTASDTMSNICENKKEELNNILSSIEQSVDIFTNVSKSKIDSLDLFFDDDLYNGYISDMEALFTNISKNTNGAVAFYYRINPDLRDSLSGFFYTGYDGNFSKVPNTDLAKYEEDDIEHVGWYHIPKNNGKATWLMPYKNLNVDIYMISYVIPIYFDNTFIGVIGMDVNFNVITDKLQEDIEYDTGLVYLVVDDKIVYHENLIYNSPRVYDKNIIEAETTLLNGMVLVLSVHNEELAKEENQLIVTIVIISSALLIIFLGVAYYFIYNVIKPLKDLNNATKKVLNGEFNVNIGTYSNDEVGVLANSFKTTISVLQEKMNYINALAYKDSLTSVKSDTSYNLEVERINKQLNEDIKLHLLVFDINNLKVVNDKFGHEYGNKLIVSSANAIVAIFGEENTYRIGGDEFAVIIENEDDQIVKQLIDDYDILIQNSYLDLPNLKHKIEIAYGYSKFNFATDTCFEDVFNRADALMYYHKRKLKSK
jgi:diguanylate cyclase (GGDEF)-like protein